MTFCLSTNWSSSRLDSGEALAEEAKALGFDALELGFNTTELQAEGVRKRLDLIPVESVHAFCPIPLSAPYGYPELYQLASLDANARAIARVQVTKNVVFAAGIGAQTVVLHAGRVPCHGFFSRGDVGRRHKRGQAFVDVLRTELEALVPVLEKEKVVLGLENLPYLEGFPAEWELAAVCGEWVRPWFDTGHDYVRRVQGWRGKDEPYAPGPEGWPIGLHVNDSVGGDDHLAPGQGKIDFAALTKMAQQARHRVFEPNSLVTPDALRQSLLTVRSLWDQ